LTYFYKVLIRGDLSSTLTLPVLFRWYPSTLCLCHSRWSKL